MLLPVSHHLGDRLRNGLCLLDKVKQGRAK